MSSSRASSAPSSARSSEHGSVGGTRSDDRPVRTKVKLFPGTQERVRSAEAEAEIGRALARVERRRVRHEEIPVSRESTLERMPSSLNARALRTAKAASQYDANGRRKRAGRDTRYAAMYEGADRIAVDARMLSNSAARTEIRFNKITATAKDKSSAQRSSEIDAAVREATMKQRRLRGPFSGRTGYEIFEDAFPPSMAGEYDWEHRYRMDDRSDVMVLVPPRVHMPVRDQLTYAPSYDRMADIDGSRAEAHAVASRDVAMRERLREARADARESSVRVDEDGKPEPLDADMADFARACRPSSDVISELRAAAAGHAQHDEAAPAVPAVSRRRRLSSSSSSGSAGGASSSSSSDHAWIRPSRMRLGGVV